MDFNQPYKQNEFLSFLSNFLPDDFEQTKEQINLSDLSFKPDKIKKIKMMGTVPSLDNLRVYEIKHHSEFDPRVTLSRETFRLMSNYGVRKILAVFISENSPNYRFSLATVDLKLKDTRVTKEYSNPRRYSFYLGPDAKIHTPTKYLSQKVKDYKELQNRFSIEVVTKEFFSELSNWYFWALKNIECPKDAKKEKNGKNIWTIRLITRLIFIWFMKEKGLVPDYLFDGNELSKFLNDLSPKENTYYKAILQNLFFATLNTPIDQRRFTDEGRFNKGFNIDFGNDLRFRYHGLFINPEDMKSIFNNIPFLNGGLFECLDNRKAGIIIDGFSRTKKNQPEIPNFLFFSEEHDEDLNEDYGTKNKKYKVRGIIDLLQTYNFTIDESTPVDVEIALDPELLGRVFENLLASYNPETATTARKATGSYYTPREIVDYMVTQSLKEHFKTKLSEQDCHCDPDVKSGEAISKTIELDDKLNDLLSYDSEENPFNDKETDILINSVNNLKIIDPAVGSGAFAMGILQKLVLVLSKLDPHNEKWKNQQIKSIEENITDVILKKELIEKTEDNFKKNELDYGRKLYLIQNCIYGIDIQPIAIQIARLRFFISLLVDEKRDREQDENYGIDPLPNLELKFISANSLIGLNIEEGELDLKDSRLSKLEEDLKRVREIYFRTSDMKQKEKLRREDKEIRDKISALLQDTYHTEDTKKISEWDPYNSNKSADWFDPEWMFGIKHPSSPVGEGKGEGGFDIVIANPPYVSVKEIERSYKKAFSQVFDCGHGRFNLFTLFIERGHKILKNAGILTFILPEGLYSNVEYRYIRKYILDKSSILYVALFSNRVFEAAVDTSIISIMNKSTVSNNFPIIKDLTQKIVNINQNLFNELPYNLFIVNLENESKEIIFKLLNIQGDNMKSILEIQQGVIYSGQSKQNVFSNTCLDKRYKKVLDGRDVLKWKINWENKMENKFICYTDKLHRPRDERLFLTKEKILLPRKSTKIYGAYDDQQYYCLNTAYVCLLKRDEYNLKFILAILNSKLINYIYSKVFFGWQVTIPALNSIIIPKTKDQKPFIEIVDKILSITKAEDYITNPSKQTKVKEYEKQIDQMVYKLYGLTDEEMEIIENSIKKSPIF